MENYWKAEKFCDVTLIAGASGTKIPTHRLVLIATSEFFATFVELDVDDVEEILAKDDLGIENEEDAFLCMMKWINHHMELRHNHFPDELLKYIRLTLIAPSFIKEFNEAVCGSV